MKKSNNELRLEAELEWSKGKIEALEKQIASMNDDALRLSRINANQLADERRK